MRKHKAKKGIKFSQAHRDAMRGPRSVEFRERHREVMRQVHARRRAKASG